MFKSLVALLLATVFATIVVAEEAYFTFQYQPYQEEFTFKLTDSAKIQEARDILSGQNTDGRVHVMGRIKKIMASYNSPWSFSLDPDTVQFFSLAIEVCDANIGYTEDHLDEACGAFLPGCFWCPWNSVLIREVTK